MALRRQWEESQADPASATFASTPVEGNLLIAAGMERSGTATSSATISGTGWTQRIAIDLGGDNRRSFVVWTKLAGASEPTNIQYDDGTTNTKQLLIQEFEFESGEDQFEFLEKAENNNGETDNATSISTGTTASVNGDKFLVVGFLAVKIGNVGGTEGSTWDSGLGNFVMAGGGVFGRHISSAYDGDAVAESTYASTGTYTNDVSTANEGLIGAIMVFSLIAAAPGGAGGVSPAIYKVSAHILGGGLVRA